MFLTSQLVRCGARLDSYRHGCHSGRGIWPSEFRWMRVSYEVIETYMVFQLLLRDLCAPVTRSPETRGLNIMQ